MSLTNWPMAARPVSGAMLGRRLTPSSDHMAMMAGLSMRRCALMNFSLKARIAALGSAGGARVCGERRKKKRKTRARKVERHAVSMSLPPEGGTYRNRGEIGRGRIEEVTKRGESPKKKIDRNAQRERVLVFSFLGLRWHGEKLAVCYMAMGSLAWRETYQQGLSLVWGKMVRVQGRSSSGRVSSSWYSVLLPFWGMASMRMR